MAHFITDKRTMETLSYIINFSELLSDSDTQLDTDKTSVILYNSKKEDKTALVLQKLIFSGKSVTLVLKDGLDGEDYTIYITGRGDVSYLTLAPTRVLELRVRDSLCGNV
jgi:hypothetical protein